MNGRGEAAPAPAARAAGKAAGTQRPTLPPEIKQVFLPGSSASYEPRLIGAATVRFSDARDRHRFNKGSSPERRDRGRIDSDLLGIRRDFGNPANQAGESSSGRCDLRRATFRRGESEEFFRMGEGLSPSALRHPANDGVSLRGDKGVFEIRRDGRRIPHAYRPEVSGAKGRKGRRDTEEICSEDSRSRSKRVACESRC